MEVENIGIPVILQDLKVICDDARRNSNSVISQEIEPNGSDNRRHSIALVPQEMESEGGDRMVPVFPQETEPNGDDFRKDSVPLIPQEAEPSGDESDDSVVVITPEIEPEGCDIRRNSIPMVHEETDADGDDISRNSIPVITEEMDPNGGDVRRNSFTGVPQEMEPKDGDIRRNSVIVIPVGIEANGADIRRRSIARKIQSRYLRASISSCHDYCKYGMRKGCGDENFETSPSADRKRTSTINSPDSFVTEKRVISVIKKGTVSLKKVSSPFKEVDVPMEDSIHLKGKRGQLEPSSKVIPTVSPDAENLNNSSVTEKNVIALTKKGDSLEKEIDVTMEDSMDLEEEPEQLEPSSLPGSVRSLRNSKVISTINPKPSPDSGTKKLNSSVVTEKRVLSLTKREAVSSRKASSPFKEIDASTKDSNDLKVKSRISPNPSQDSETRKLNNSVVIKKNVLSLKKKETASPKNETSSFEEIDASMEEQGSSNKGNSETRKSKEAPDRYSSGGNRSIRNNNRRTSLPGETKTMGLQTVSLSSQHSNKRDSNTNIGSPYNLKGLSHLKDQNDTGKGEPEPPGDKDMPEKVLYVIESSTQNSNVESTPNGVRVPKLSQSSSLSFQGKSLKHARKGISRAGSSPSSVKKLKPVIGVHSRSARPLGPEHKGLRRTPRVNQASLSPSSSSSSMSISLSESTHDKENGATSQHDTIGTVMPMGNSKVQHRSTPRRSGVHGSGNKNSVPRKLTFRRGRVVTLQPENTTPRRLKFRRVRLAVEIQNSTTRGSIGNVRKEVDDGQSNGAGIMKRASNARKEVGDRQSNGVGIKRGIIGNVRKEVDDGQSNGAQIISEKAVLRNEGQVEVSPRKSLRRKGLSVGLWNGIRSNPEKVVLRHRVVGGKKDDQKLFNNVIEETASKLVETRKSKVRALVGAFETVISLQDIRPAATADAC
ncbi:hypothetical protein M0R45_023320 [Rubus argutus]|uniref:Calmodulin-binding domain-containing protein n=1 Tax=Rubus argutus TaxID=59490 RepID=A0AAW1WQZ4_RUBAR